MSPPAGPTDPFDGLSETWWDEAGVLHALGVLLDPVRVPFVVDVLGSELGTGPHRVLDVGAGGGLFSVALGEHGFSVVAVDPSVASLRAGKKRAAEGAAAIGFLAGCGERLPFGDGSFDAIVSASSFTIEVSRLGFIQNAAWRFGLPE